MKLTILAETGERRSVSRVYRQLFLRSFDSMLALPANFAPQMQNGDLAVLALTRTSDLAVTFAEVR
jgi:hypothetical protein